SIAANGNLYFQARQSDEDDANIFVSHYGNGGYLTPIKLSSAINGPGHNCHPYIAPDESYLIFDCERPDGYGEMDLYISFRKENGEWTEAKNMGPKVNSPNDERRSFVTYDGKYLFFDGYVLNGAEQLPDQPITFEEFRNFTNAPGNGSADFYWVDAKVIDELKPKDLK
ncbi:MAG: hypothetical protein MUO43_02095, partial [Desulfobacterales bacterium]|nr:hypothetical protein [Desulfobacterales bacterium]